MPLALLLLLPEGGADDERGARVKRAPLVRCLRRQQPLALERRSLCS